jgi:hypothetical protein
MMALAFEADVDITGISQVGKGAATFFFDLLGVCDLYFVCPGNVVFSLAYLP